jgi:ribosome-associated protein
MTSTELAGQIAAAAADKKARDVVTLDIRGKTTIADYFVICEGDTDRQVRAIVDSIEEACVRVGVRPLHIAGVRDASWACIDFDSVIVHVFLPGERTFYDLEGLWGAAPFDATTSLQGETSRR